MCSMGIAPCARAGFLSRGVLLTAPTESSVLSFESDGVPGAHTSMRSRSLGSAALHQESLRRPDVTSRQAVKYS